MTMAWLEHILKKFQAIFESEKPLREIIINPAIPGQGVLELSADLVEWYARITPKGRTAQEMHHLQGTCSHLARNKNYASAFVEIKYKKGRVKSISLIVQD